MARTRLPAWVSDADTWRDFLAAVRNHDHKYAEPERIHTATSRQLEFASMARAIRRAESLLPDAQWDDLDRAGFVWEAGDRPLLPQVVDTARAGASGDELLRNGLATIEEVLELRWFAADGCDPLITWVAAGADALRSNQLSVALALSDPELTLETPDGTFFAGAWARELARAERYGHVSSVVPSLTKRQFQPIGQRGLILLERIGHVLEYTAEHGDTEISTRHVVVRHTGEPIALGDWLRSQRERAAAGKLSAGWRGALEAAGVRLQTRGAKYFWAIGLAAVERHRELHGDAPIISSTIVTLDDGTTVAVGQWLTSQRYRYSVGRLDERRAQELRDRGVDLAKRRDLEAWWARGLAALDAYIAEHGNARAPLTAHVTLPDGTDVALGDWLDSKRRARQAGTMPPEQVAALDARNIIWQPEQHHRETALGALTRFRSRVGHGRVPQHHVEVLDDGTTFNLGFWVNNMRQAHKRGTMSPERVALLTEHGFVFDPYADKRAEKLAALDQFHAREGHLDVPRGHVEQLTSGRSIDLGTWCTNARERYWTNRLNRVTIAELDARGFTWATPGRTKAAVPSGDRRSR